jgi:FkbM family methyltransferase
MKLVRQARSAVNVVLDRLDHQLVPNRKVVSPKLFLGLLASHGLAPRTVFDIGVAAGTAWLYEAFPEARYVLVDPTRESLPHMQRWAEKLEAEILNVALGAEDGTASIRVAENIERSGLLEEAEPLAVTAQYEVPVRRFDSMIGAFERPALCKIDAQGAEIRVLQGMGRHLQAIDAYIIETSLLSPFRGGPEIFEVMRLMHEHGYVLHDITGNYRRHLDLALAQIDAAFVPCDSPLRQQRRWG